ncbi:MAG TPA: GNAT family N-acetyltransferase [Polyangiaceae bacterium]|jgi:ribosomal protein S18 acetylase RimI-like enzyme|nr:GNAT family N-acetyltransferase [Polyangiaceae bacterium]
MAESKAMGMTSEAPRNAVAMDDVGAPLAQESAPVRLSETLWGIDWAEHMPWQAPGDVVAAEVASPERLMRFVSGNYGMIFGDTAAAGFWSDSVEARERYLRHVCDAFIYRDGSDDVGVFIGNPVDWSTYYLRSIAFLPTHQGHQLGPGLVEHVCRILAAHGVVRVELDAAPSNVACAKSALSIGFVLSGTALSERWGALARYTRYLNPDAEGAFIGRYCASGTLHKTTRARRSASGRGH